jgi:hypothetical protein
MAKPVPRQQEMVAVGLVGEKRKHSVFNELWQSASSSGRNDGEISRVNLADITAGGRWQINARMTLAK